MSGTKDQVRVAVGLGSRAYDILIGPGLLQSAAERISVLLPEARVAIVTDETVGAIYLEQLQETFSRAGSETTASGCPRERKRRVLMRCN